MRNPSFDSQEFGAERWIFHFFENNSFVDVENLFLYHENERRKKDRRTIILICFAFLIIFRLLVFIFFKA